MINPPPKVASFQWARAGAIAAAGSILLAGATRLQAQTPASPRDTNALPQVEVRARALSLKRRVRAFVAAVTPRIYSSSLLRWNEPICPVVVGPPPDQSARILAHVSQIATAAGVAIKQKPCQANFFIIATPYPERLLTAWGKRDRLLFAEAGQKSIDAFINTPRPVRVWYNTITAMAAPQQQFADPQPFGAIPAPAAAANQAGGTPAEAASADASANTDAAVDAAQAHSFYYFDDVQSFTSVIVVVDTKRAAGFRLDQLSDYIAMVGLSKIDVNADYHGAPTILSMFAPSGSGAAQPAPASITSWDRDYLKDLYATRQVSREQRSEITDMMVHDMSP